MSNKPSEFFDGHNPEFRDEVVVISNLVVAASAVAHKTFTGCSILGPAFLLIQDDVSIIGCSFASPEVFIPTSRLEVDQVFGVIPVTHTSFVQCRFEKINILVPGDELVEEIQTSFPTQ